MRTCRKLWASESGGRKHKRTILLQDMVPAKSCKNNSLKVQSSSENRSDSAITILNEEACYPESNHFRSKATQRGCAHYKSLLTAYQHQQEKHHRALKVSSSGFVKSTEYLRMGASPNGIINCDCCWQRILEVKCPFSCVFSRSHHRVRFLPTRGHWQVYAKTKLFVLLYTTTNEDLWN